MRRIGMLLLILLLLCGCAYAQEPEPETEVVTDGLSDEARELLPTENAGTVDLWDGAKTVLTGALARAFGGWHEALRLCALLLAVLTFCALLQWQKEPPAALVVVGALGIAGATVASMQSMVQLAAGTIEELSAYGTCMLPVLASATAMSGGVSSSTALYGGAVLFSQLLTRAISKLLIPGVWLFLAVATAEAALGNQMLTELRKLIGWLISKGLKLFVGLFLAYLSLTGVITASVDASAAKMTKAAVSGMVPVVGGMISDASETLLASAGVLKNSVGVFGMLAVLAIALTPFLRVAAHYLLLRLTTAVGGAVALKPHVTLLEQLTTAMGFLLAMCAACCLLLLMATVCLMRVVV